MTDFGAQISTMLAEGLTWKEIGMALGFVRQGKRRFTAAEDTTIREEWVKNTPVQTIAQMLGRDYGTVRQRILRLDLPKRGGVKTRLIRRYGADIVKLGDTAEDMRARIAEAEAAARKAASDAKAAKKRTILDDMLAKIASGCDRNDAIFMARSAGLHLEEIAQEFGITRERVRQICNQVAMYRALAAQSANGHAPADAEWSAA